MQTNPTQAAIDLCIALGIPDHHAPAIQAAFAEREASECDVMLKVTWHDAPKPEAKELGRRVKLAQELLLNGEVVEQAEREARLVEALTDVGASLAAAISLLERGGKAAKKAAPSDRMFDQMLKDYSASLERARATLASLKDRTHD